MLHTCCNLTAAPLDSLTEFFLDVFRFALLRRAPACVCFSFASVNPPLAPRIFCYGFGSCLRPGLTYITLINKGCTATRMSHYGISPGHPAPPALIESHQSPHLSSGWLGAQARCLAYLFCCLRILLQTRRSTRTEVFARPQTEILVVCVRAQTWWISIDAQATPPPAAPLLYLHCHCFFALK